MSEPALMYLIRHGATKQNEARPVVLQGKGINGPLSARGEQQARDVAGALAEKPLKAIYASPMVRAQQTAQAIAEQHGLPVATLAEIHEVNVGAWEGKTWTEIMEQERDHYDRHMADPTVPYRDGESFQNVYDRVSSHFEMLLEKHRGESFAVVAHNVVNRVYLSWLLHKSLVNSRKIHQMNCCLNLIQLKDEEPQLITLNSVFHLSNW